MNKNEIHKKITFYFLVALTITLVGYFSSKLYKATYHPCQQLDSGTKEIQVQCWEQVASRITKKDGSKKAFNMLPVFLSKNPKFGESCHEYLHYVGHFSYSYYWDFKN